MFFIKSKNALKFGTICLAVALFSAGCSLIQADLDKRAKYEAETGKCANCSGSGRQYNVASGEVDPCLRCRGTGKAR